MSDLAPYRRIGDDGHPIVTRATALDSPIEFSRATPTLGSGSVMARRDARQLGAVTTTTGRTFNTHPMRRNRGIDRRMSVRFVDPATLKASA